MLSRMRLGRYELGRRIAAGGMGEVYEGRDRQLGRPVAVKLLRTEAMDMPGRARFEREGKLMACFSHPNAVTVYDVGEEDGRPYLVMELVDGESLTTLLRRRGRLDAVDAVAIADQVLTALAAAHDAGLVHRDIKPGNILVARDGSAKLADFGIAKAIADSGATMTGTGEVIGTAKYVSPEQVSGLPADSRSDIYSVG